MPPAQQFAVSRWERIRTFDPRIRDALLGIAVFALTLLVGFRIDVGRPHPDVLAVALIALGTLPLALRRRAPLIVLAVIGAAGAAYALREDSANLSLPLAIAAYTVAAHRDRRTVVTIGLPIAVAASLVMTITEQRANWVEVVIALITVPGVPLLLGRVSYNRRRRVARDHVLAAREAVATERARIARELHDVVAHSMSVMVVQAGAARAVLGRDPNEAADALRRVEDTGRSGLAEMRRLLGILKSDGDGSGVAPQPGLAELDELLDRMRAAGVPVECMVEGEERPLLPSVDLTAYRVVQEALTNTLKHAGGAHARVVIRYTDGGLDIEVVDDGRGPPPAGGAPGGHGLVGMRERVELFGGTLDTGGRTGGGFRVTVHVPVTEDAT